MYIDNIAVLSRVAGKDASKQFWKYHSEGVLKKYKGKLQVGSLDSKKAAAPSAPAPAPAKEAPKPSPAPAPTAPAAPAQASQAHEPYGDLVPFADPAWYHGVSIRHRCPWWKDTMLMIPLLRWVVLLSILQRIPRVPPC